MVNGLLALSTCAYLAAIYLTNETAGELREDFRRRAIFAGTTTAVLAGAAFGLAFFEARWFFDRLLSVRVLPVIAVGLACFAGSCWSVFTRRWRLGRLFAAGEIALVLVGWAMAQYPYLVYPDVSFAAAAAPMTTQRFMVLSLVPGLALLVPSLALLFAVFKTPAEK